MKRLQAPDTAAMTAKAPVLLLVCAITGQTVDTGVRYGLADLARVTSAKVRMRCPHCGETHEFKFADATLRPAVRLNGWGVADTDAARTGRHPPRFIHAVWRGEPDSRS
jgi:hypothetical protein